MHKHCLQFRLKIRNLNNLRNGSGNLYNNSYNNNNENLSEAVIDDGMVFSELVDKLYKLTVDRGITYTITECLLDQVIDKSKKYKIF